MGNIFKQKHNKYTKEGWAIICGWGIYDCEKPYMETINLGNGVYKKVICPYYEKWRSILRKVYDNKFLKRNSSYLGTTICSEWKYFSAFKRWVDSQPNRNWFNCHLDKDLISDKRKHYSPETCVFISKSLNNFLTDRRNDRGEFFLGVNWKPKINKYEAKCNNPFEPKANRYIGVFSNELEAHKAWQAKKHEYACRLAELQSDLRVAKALRERYAPDKDWTNR